MSMDFYRPGASFLHRFDPRAKLLLLPPLLACFFLPVPPWLLLPYVVAIAVVAGVSLGARSLGAPLKAIAPVLILICLLTPPFHRGGTGLWWLFGFPIVTSDGLSETAVLLLRFVGIALGFFAVFSTIVLDDLVLAMRWFGIPYPACLVVIIALRTIPSLAATWRNVKDAHRLRGHAEELGHARRRPLASYLPMLTSVLIEAVKGIPVLAMVLESRGFGRRNPRTAFAELKKGGTLVADFLATAAVALLLLAPALWPLLGR
jgi:energy-coupling factor transport system permease protein